MILRQIIEYRNNIVTFDWEIVSKRGKYARIESKDAILCFNVVQGENDEVTLANAEKKLEAMSYVPSKFEYCK